MAEEFATEDTTAEQTEPAAVKEVSDDFVTRQHTTPSGLSYTTTTGRLVLRREETKDGKSEGFKPKAEIFVVA